MRMTKDIAEATFCIEYNNSTGTAFAVDVGGVLCFITVRHLFLNINLDNQKGDLDNGDGDYEEVLNNVKIVFNNHTRSFPSCKARVYTNPKYDCALIVPEPFDGMAEFHSLPFDYLTRENLAMGSDVLLVGFPFVWLNYKYRIKNPDESYPFYLPIIKAGIVSAFEPVNGKYMLIASHNNEGFSGGPVVWKKSDRVTCILGIIAGYYPDYFDGHFCENSNSGFTCVCPIERAVKLINKYVKP